MGQNSPLVSTVIVNYNSGTYLRACLSSLRAQSMKDNEIIVIDNASADESPNILTEFRETITIRNPSNIGFAAAQNQGMRRARAQYLLPLNFDIQLEPNFVEQMISALESSARAGAVCGKLMKMTPDGQHTKHIYSTGHLLPPNRFPLHRGAGEEDYGQYQQLTEVFGSPGAAALYRREMLDDVAFRGQYFDESFFTWYEDVDLDWRARWRGWHCVYTPFAVAHHVGQREGVHRSASYVATTIRNRWLMISANECTQCMRRNWRALIAYEISLLRYTVRSRLFSAYVAALRSYQELLLLARMKRKHIQARAVRSCALDD